jgi:hypothetical protein
LKGRTLICAASVLFVSACTSAAAAAPDDLLLQPSDVAVAYSAEVDDDVPFVMRDCLVDNLGQRIDGAMTAAIFFEGQGAGNSFSHLVATTGARDPGDVLDEIEHLLRDCGSKTDASISSDSVMTTTTTRELADGPAVGDKSVWTSFTLDVAHSSGLTSGGDDASPSVVFLHGGAIHRLTAPVTLGWDEAVEFILDHAGKL